MTIQTNYLENTKRLLLVGVAACALAAVPMDFQTLDFSAAYAQGNDNAGSGNSGSGGSDNSGGANSGGSNSGSDNAGGANAGGSSAGSDNAGGANAGGANAGGSSDDGGESDSDDDSDRPEWAGEPGGKDGVGGGQPDNSGTTKGDIFGDLFIILRDDNGVPILTADGWVQPLDADGNPLPLDEEGHPLDESLTQEVELGRLNVGRAPTQVLETRIDEVIGLLNDADSLSKDAAGRLVITIDGVAKTIDSPLENLAVYVALMTTGTIPGVNPIDGEFSYLADGELTAADLEASASFLAAATDKTGVFTSDEIAYINTFLDVNNTTVGNVTYSEVDFSDFSYDRSATYGDVTVEVLVLTDGVWVPTTVNVIDAVFGGVATGEVSGTLEAYTAAAEDARMVINFIHEYALPAETL